MHKKSEILFATSIFLNNGFNFQPNVCSGSHNVLMMSMKLSNVDILKANVVDYRNIITRISKSRTL